MTTKGKKWHYIRLSLEVYEITISLELELSVGSISLSCAAWQGFKKEIICTVTPPLNKLEHCLDCFTWTIEEQTIRSKSLPLLQHLSSDDDSPTFRRFWGTTHCQIIINLSYASNENTFRMRSCGTARCDCQAQREKINTCDLSSLVNITDKKCILHNHQIVLSHSKCGIQWV